MLLFRHDTTPPRAKGSHTTTPVLMSDIMFSKTSSSSQLHTRLLGLVLSVCCGIALVPTEAFAQDAETARMVEQLSDAAVERYLEKDYKGAIKLFEQAYELDPVPTLLFNIAKCHEKLQHWDEAIDFYELFIVEPEIDTQDRKAALERIEKLREIKETQKDLKQDGDPDGDKDPNGSGDVTDKGDPKNSGGTKTEEVTGPSKVPGIIFLGAGLAALGGGALFGIQAQQTQNTFDTTTDIDAKRTAQSTGTRQALTADGLYAGGAVLSVIGTVLLIRASRDKEAPQQTSSSSTEGASKSTVRFQPVLGKGLGGLHLRMTF